MSFDAFWPPHIAQHGVQERPIEGGAVLRFPVHTGASVVQLCQALAARRTELRLRSAADLCAALAAAAEQLGKGSLLQEALTWIPLTTGYSPEMTQYVLQRMARDWTAPALERLLAAELGNAAVLDTFTAQDHTPRRALAIGPRVTGHIFSGNVPGVAVTSLIRSLLVKSPSIGKTAAEEPVLAVLFARALAEVDARLADALVVTHWPGGTPELDGALLDHCDTVVIYGGADTVEALRARARPETRLVVHGPKISLGVLGPGALGRATAYDVARAVATFDQQGCVSPHVVYVAADEKRARDFARSVAEQLQTVGVELPRGRLTTAEAIAIQHARTSAEFRAIAGADVDLHANDALNFTVVYERDPTFRASCLNRFVYVKLLTDVHALTTLLAPYGALLQSVALEGFDSAEQEKIASELAEIGVSRISTFAEQPWPTAEWRHDGGYGALRELLRWAEI